MGFEPKTSLIWSKFKPQRDYQQHQQRHHHQQQHVRPTYRLNIEFFIYSGITSLPDNFPIQQLAGLFLKQN